MSIYAPSFMELFKGMEEAYGENAISDKPVDPQTKKKQGQAVTIRKSVTEVLWVRHLAGRKTLGIIPIDKMSMCQWGAVDIDNYDLDIMSFSKAFYKRNLPLIPFRSKSGGCHLILFLDFVKDYRVTPKELKAIKVLETNDALPEGPPCLQALVQQGFPQGTRNNGLFAIGVYCRKAFPDNWEQEIETKNTECMDPPLDSKEVQLIVKQVGKKDYNYKCNDQPLSSFCNSALCRTRKHGIGGGAMPTMKRCGKL